MAMGQNHTWCKNLEVVLGCYSSQMTDVKDILQHS